MSTTAALPDPEEVLQHLDWVRGLALHLVGDAAEADDLRQEVWVLAQRLDRPSRIPIRGWLSGLLRNRVRDRRRAANTRTYHEENSALVRARSAHESLAVRQASMHQVLVERLMTLREPYRSTLLARYFEDLSHAEIAERDGVALATVRSRLQRGLSELREDLDQKDRQNGSLLALLALHTWSPQDVGQGVAAGSWLAYLGVLATGVGITIFAFWPDAKPSSNPAAGPEVVQGDTKLVASPSPNCVVRQPIVETQTTSEPESKPVAVPGTLPVSIVNLDGQPILGEEVMFMRFLPDGSKAPGPFAVTDGNGRAMVEGVAGRGTIYCPRTRNIQLGIPNAGEKSPADQVLVVVLAPSSLLEGTVRSESGDPIQGARIRLAFQEVFPGAIGRHLAHSNHAEFKATSDADGRFSIKIAKCSQPVGLICDEIGLQTLQRSDLVFESDPEPMQLVMQAVQDPNVAFGTLRSETGEPLVGAWLGDGERVVRTQEDGSFQIGPVQAGAILWAGAPGHLPKEIGQPENMHDLEVSLSRGDLPITGRVLLPDGQGAVGLQIRLRSKQPVGTHFFPYGGRNAFVAMAVEDFAYPAQVTIPGRAMGITGQDGTIRLSGLLPRDYTLEVFDPQSLLQIEGLSFPAGAKNVRIDCPLPPAQLLGSVNTPDGKPMVGVLVRTLAASSEFRQGPQVRSNAAGQFLFPSLKRGCSIQVDAPFPYVHVGVLAQGEDPIVCTPEHAARITLALDLNQEFAGGNRLPQSAYFLDASGQAVTFVVDDIRYYRHDQFPIEPDEANLVAPTPMVVPIRARELVFADSDGPIHSLALSLMPGQELHLSE